MQPGLKNWQLPQELPKADDSLVLLTWSQGRSCGVSGDLLAANITIWLHGEDGARAEA